jgi:CheY-like chemotaxis protein
MTDVTVLLAGGDLDCRVIYGTMLRQRGFRVLEAVNGEEAVRRAREEVPSVLVLETMLPSMGGFEVAARLREDPSMAGIRLVAVTSSAQAEDRRTAAGIGFVRYLVKPCSPSDLAAEVARLLNQGDG